MQSLKEFIVNQQVDCGQLDGEQFSKEHGFAGYFETSAKTGAGVKEAIHFMVKKVCVFITIYTYGYAKQGIWHVGVVFPHAFI